MPENQNKRIKRSKIMAVLLIIRNVIWFWWKSQQIIKLVIVSRQTIIKILFKVKLKDKKKKKLFFKQNT